MSIEQRLITSTLQNCEQWAPGYMEGACIMRQKYAPKYGTHGAPSNVKMDAYYIAKTVDGKKYRITLLKLWMVRNTVLQGRDSSNM